MSTETVGQRIRRLRDDRELSQEKLAHLVGVTRQTIYRIERDQPESLRKETWEGLARELGVSVLYLQYGYHPVGESGEGLPPWHVVLRGTSVLPDRDIELIRRMVEALEAEQLRVLARSEKEQAS